MGPVLVGGGLAEYILEIICLLLKVRLTRYHGNGVRSGINDGVMTSLQIEEKTGQKAAQSNKYYHSTHR